MEKLLTFVNITAATIAFSMIVLVAMATWGAWLFYSLKATPKHH